MFDDLITYSAPPPNRLGKCEGDHEHHLPEGAVMVAFAMHLLRTVPGLREVSVHPDGDTASGSISRDGSESRGS